MKFQGKVIRQQVGLGSKSEHQAVMLLTPEGPLKLRRPQGNPFQDPVLEKLVGQEIACNGEVYRGQLMLADWHKITAADEHSAT